MVQPQRNKEVRERSVEGYRAVRTADSTSPSLRESLIVEIIHCFVLTCSLGLSVLGMKFVPLLLGEFCTAFTECRT